MPAGQRISNGICTKKPLSGERKQIGGQPRRHPGIIAIGNPRRRRHAAPVTADRQPGELRPQPQDILGDDTQLTQGARARGLDDDVGLQQQSPQPGKRLWAGKIQHHALLAVIQQIEEGRRPQTRTIRSLPAFNLQHPRSGMLQQMATQRPGPQCRQIDHQRHTARP